jgi:ferredoxin-type protein NapF
VSMSNPRRRAFLQGRFSETASPVGRAVARVESTCLARHNIACEICRDSCGAAAIKFIPRVPVSTPRIVADLCTGCGECVAVCPSGALILPAHEAAPS